MLQLYLVMAHEQVLAVNVLEQVDNSEEPLLDLLFVVLSAKRFLSEQTVHVRRQRFWKLVVLPEDGCAVQKLVESLKKLMNKFEAYFLPLSRSVVNLKCDIKAYSMSMSVSS